MTIDFTITRLRYSKGPEEPEEIEIDCEVEFVYWPATRGARDSFNGKRSAGPQLEPDEPAYFEFIKAVNANDGSEIDLTDSELEEAEEKANDSL